MGVKCGTGSTMYGGDWKGRRPQQGQLHVLLLLLCGDVETNPGPFPLSLPSLPSFDKKEDPVEVLQEVVDEQADKISELKELLEKQTEMILNIEAKLTDYSEHLKVNKTELEKTKWENAKLREELGHQNAKFEDIFETLQKEDRDIVHSLAKQKSKAEESIEYLKYEVNEMKGRLNSGVDKIDKTSDSATSRVEKMENMVEALKEQLWELDTANRNNLVFYGVREEGFSPEAAIRDVIKRKLAISRDINMLKVRRAQGSAVRGTRPITVCFERYQDKNAILRKSKLLRGTNILVTEDFPKRVREHRAELARFAKEIRRNDPDARIQLQWDKLYINNEVYIYSEDTGTVEHEGEFQDMHTPTSKSAHARGKRTPYYSRLGTPGPRRSRMSKAYSTESNLALNTSPLKSARIKDDPTEFDDLETELDFDDDLDNDDLKTVI